MLLTKHTFSELKSFGPSLPSVCMGDVAGNAARRSVGVGVRILLVHVNSLFIQILNL